MIRLDLGDLEVSVLDAGSLWLDGGSMFGVVPKALWSRERVPDELNRIELAMNVMLVDDGRSRTLVDTGAGTVWTEKQERIYRLDPRTPEQILAPVGLTPEQVDRVVVTHLHFDHAGGNTERTDDGSFRAAFPRAEYWIRAGEIETARWNNERTRGSYVAEHFEPLLEEPGRVRRIAVDTSVVPGVQLRLAPGHTPHMQVVIARGGRRTAAFLADLVPTTSHVRDAYIMGFDLEPLATLATKKRVLREALAEDWWVVLEHDREAPIARLAEVDGKIVAEAAAGD